MMSYYDAAILGIVWSVISGFVTYCIVCWWQGRK